MDVLLGGRFLGLGRPFGGGLGDFDGLDRGLFALGLVGGADGGGGGGADGGGGGVGLSCSSATLSCTGLVCPL